MRVATEVVPAREEQAALRRLSRSKFINVGSTQRARIVRFAARPQSLQRACWN